MRHAIILVLVGVLLLSSLSFAGSETVEVEKNTESSTVQEVIIGKEQIEIRENVTYDCTGTVTVVNTTHILCDAGKGETLLEFDYNEKAKQFIFENVTYVPNKTVLNKTVFVESKTINVTVDSLGEKARYSCDYSSYGECRFDGVNRLTCDSKSAGDGDGVIESGEEGVVIDFTFEDFKINPVGATHYFSKGNTKITCAVI